MIYKAILIMISAGLVLTAFANDKTGEEINWQAISTGGSQGSISTNYQLSSTVGQTATGGVSSTNFGLNHGYWQVFGGGPCDCEPGNANGDTTINIFDITYIIVFLYMGGPAPVPYALCSGDPNCDCTCNISDITYLINFFYLIGPPPCTCEDWLTACGPPLIK